MSSPIIIGQPDPNDPMVQRAMMAQQQEEQMKAIIGQIQNQVLVSTFTRLSIEHLVSGEPLTIEVGRELAEQSAELANHVCKGYSGFLFEKLGLAQVNVVDPEA